MAVLREFRIIILLTVFSTFVDCQITSSPSLEDVCVGDDVELDWVYGNDANFLSVTWTYINSQTSVQTTIMQQARGGTASVVNNYNVVHKTNGAITLTDVTKANSGSYKISVTYLSASAVDDTVTVTVKDCTATTTTISTTSTTTSTSTTTTTSASTTTTSSSTTTTTSPTTMTTPSTSTTTPASTTSTMPTTSMRIPITTSMPPTTSTTPASISTSSTKTSDEGLSVEIIIVIVIVPVGVIAVVGTVIFFCLFYRLRRGKRKPASHERHKQGKHYKGNMRPVQQHQQQPYILYGGGHTRQSSHKETKRSQSLNDNDRYNWYDGYHWGSQVKQNPMYKGDRNLSRLYNNESLPRYDAYMSGYTKGHVYPSHTSDYHYRPDYHGDSRRHRNHQYSSYPVYSTQQEYMDPSYSYMGY